MDSMRLMKLMIVALAAALGGCQVPPKPPPTRSRPPFQAKGPVPRPYNIQAAQRLVLRWLPKGVTITKRQHIPAIHSSLVAYPSPCPEDTPIGERVYLQMAEGQRVPHPGRYYFPAIAGVEVYDLRNSNEMAHPTIWRSVNLLRKVSDKRPTASRLHSERFDFNRDTFPPANAAQMFHSHLRYLSGDWGSGYLVLTQYGQDNGSRVNNEELFCLFQGLSADGSRFLTATFPVYHPGLPATIDDASALSLEEGVRRLDRFPDDSFSPSLGDLEKLIHMLEIH